VISKWRILVNSEVLNLSFFFIASFLSGVWVDASEWTDSHLTLCEAVWLSQDQALQHSPRLYLAPTVPKS